MERTKELAVTISLSNRGQWHYGSDYWDVFALGKKFGSWGFSYPEDFVYSTVTSQFRLWDVNSEKACYFLFYFWNGEYEAHCILNKGHSGDHFDGSYWLNDDGEDVTSKHQEEEERWMK